MTERYWPCGVCPLSFDFCRCDPKPEERCVPKVSVSSKKPKPAKKCGNCKCAKKKPKK